MIVLAADNSDCDFLSEAPILTFHDSRDVLLFSILKVSRHALLHVCTCTYLPLNGQVDSKPAGSSLAWQSGMLKSDG